MRLVACIALSAKFLKRQKIVESDKVAGSMHENHVGFAPLLDVLEANTQCMSPIIYYDL